MQMKPLKRDQCVSWIAGFRFYDCETSKGVVVASWSGGGNMEIQGHDAYQLSFLI